ncbi:Glycosyl hydrolases family 28 [Rhizoctonia solani]|uniref:galacturonan 1,4-alpha-galacturonidase n=1 Tax=Rhizoctonia solani TaxID=456999 RepID=A0A8H7LHI6_9AGAM|nr:Glycosyl hydrolases family 28 [Rhizoctonia solani]
MLSAIFAVALGSAVALASKTGVKTQTCIVPSHGNVNISDTPAVHAAFKKCGKGGHIIFSENTNYTLRELTTMTPCIGCTVQLEGTIQMADNITYWLKNETTNTPNITAETFPHLVYYPFQDTVAYLILKDWSHSTLVSKTGKGLIDGLGQLWWDAAVGQQILLPGTLRRPVLFTLDGANNVTVDNVAMRNPANWFNWVTDSSNVVYKNIRLSALSANKNPPANADGWDTYRTSHFELRDSHIVSGDDCFAFKPNSTYITIENVYCQNSHGVSVGSLAQYPGVLDIVEHVKVKNVTFVGNGDSSSNGARIKIWSGPVGSAIVNDIHYEDLRVENVTNPLVVDSCYFSSAYCATGKPVATITNVTVTNITGTSTGKVVSSIICPEGSTCDIKLKNVNIVPKTGVAPVYRCFSVASEDLGVNCTYPTVVNGAFKWPA